MKCFVNDPILLQNCLELWKTIVWKTISGLVHICTGTKERTLESVHLNMFSPEESLVVIKIKVFKKIISKEVPARNVYFKYFVSAEEPSNYSERFYGNLADGGFFCFRSKALESR